MEKMPTDVLEEEHRFIQQVVSALPALIRVFEIRQLLQVRRPVEADLLPEIVEFMRTFADKCHHGKEEDHLFPVLVQKGVPVTGCPIERLTHEHQQGRALVSELAKAAQAYTQGDEVAIVSLVENLRGIAELYPNHIWKEDYLLFPMTNKILGADDHRDLMEKFIQADETLGHDVQRRFEEMALELESLVSQVGRTIH